MKKGVTMYIDELQKKWALQIKMQEVVNLLPRDKMASAIRALAIEEHAEYPQYAGMWDDPSWELYMCNRKVTTKGGTAFQRGDIILAQNQGDMLVGYSVRNGINTALDTKSIKKLS